MLNSKILLIFLVNIGQLLCVGQKRPVSIATFQKDPYLQEAFHESIKKYNSRINSAFLYVPYQIHSVIQQVIQFYFKFT